MCNGYAGYRAWVHQWATNNKVGIYRLLCAAFGQGVAITQVVDFDVFDKVTVLLVDLGVERSAGCGRLDAAG